jgi:maltose O-acetyltransferase
LTEREKMLAGELYSAADPELTAARRRARDLIYAFNHSRESEPDLRQQILRELFGAIGKNLWIEPPFYCDYGQNISIGNNVYFNFNCVILDPARVEIGDRVLFGPNVQIYTATHPIDAATRRTGLEAGKPIRIGSDAWVGGSAVLCPGVNIGDRTVIGAGSVVTRDLPADVFAAGNPCRVIRSLEATGV